MRNPRQFVGAFVLAAMMAALLGTASPASADSGAPGGPSKGTCGFLQGILYKMPPDVAAALAPLFNELFDCEL
jgi:hypothetical protein